MANLINSDNHTKGKHSIAWHKTSGQKAGLLFLNCRSQTGLIVKKLVVE